MHESYKEEVNVGNIINYVVAFCVEWCLSGCYRAGFFLEGRSKKESSRFSGIPIGAVLSPPVAWRVAFRWSGFDLIGVCGPALICLLLLPGAVTRPGRARCPRLLPRLARTQHVACRQGGRGGHVVERNRQVMQKLIMQKLM